MKILEDAFNNLNGMVPSTIGEMSSLLCLDLSYNFMEEGLPTEPGLLTALGK
jgi:hypothetical protein